MIPTPYTPKDEATARKIYNALLWSERIAKAQPRQQEKEIMIWWSGLQPDRRAAVLQTKRAIYSISDASAYPPLDNYIRQHKAGGDGAAYDYLCFTASLRLLQQHIGLGILPRKSKKPRPQKSLRDKIAMHLPEINQLRADGYSWPRVAMVMKRRWRKAFDGAMLERSYLRKTVQSLNSSEKTNQN